MMLRKIWAKIFFAENKSFAKTKFLPKTKFPNFVPIFFLTPKNNLQKIISHKQNLQEKKFCKKKFLYKQMLPKKTFLKRNFVENFSPIFFFQNKENFEEKKFRKRNKISFKKIL